MHFTVSAPRLPPGPPPRSPATFDMFHSLLLPRAPLLQQPLSGQEGAEVEGAAALGAAHLAAAVDEGGAAGGILLLAVAAGLVARPRALYWKRKSRSNWSQPVTLGPSLLRRHRRRWHDDEVYFVCLTSDV